MTTAVDESIDDLLAQFRDIDYKSDHHDVVSGNTFMEDTIKNTEQPPLFVSRYWKWTLFLFLVLFVYIIIIVAIIRPKTVYIEQDHHHEPTFSWKKYFFTCTTIWILLIIVMFMSQYIYVKYLSR